MTHVAVVYVSGRLASRPTTSIRYWLALACLGAILPDLLLRAPSILFSRPIIDLLLLPWHTPLGLLVVCTGLVFVFPEHKRISYLGWLLVGSASHLFLDSMQRYMVALGPYLWLFPFSDVNGQLSLFWADEIIFLMPYLFAACLVVEALVQWKARRIA